MIMVINEMSDQRRADRKSQNTKKPKTINKSSGKIKPSRDKNHHLSGCKNVLQHASKKKAAAIIFDTMMNLLVNFLNVAMNGL